MAFIVLQWIWTAAWFWNIYFAHRTLNKLPYMLTRYQQLSHRFFTVQAFAVTLYFVFQYFVVIYLISINDSAGKDNKSLESQYHSLLADVTERSRNI